MGYYYYYTQPIPVLLFKCPLRSQRLCRYLKTIPLEWAVYNKHTIKCGYASFNTYFAILSMSFSLSDLYGNKFKMSKQKPKVMKISKGHTKPRPIPLEWTGYNNYILKCDYTSFNTCFYVSFNCCGSILTILSVQLLIGSQDYVDSVQYGPKISTFVVIGYNYNNIG